MMEWGGAEGATTARAPRSGWAALVEEAADPETHR